MFGLQKDKENGLKTYGKTDNPSGHTISRDKRKRPEEK